MATSNLLILFKLSDLTEMNNLQNESLDPVLQKRISVGPSVASNSSAGLTKRYLTNFSFFGQYK